MTSAAVRVLCALWRASDRSTAAQGEKAIAGSGPAAVPEARRSAHVERAARAVRRSEWAAASAPTTACCWVRYSRSGLPGARRPFDRRPALNRQAIAALRPDRAAIADGRVAQSP